MAFNAEERNNTQAPATGRNAIPDDKKAVGYINFYLPSSTETGKKKLGAIALRAGTSNEVALSNWLQANPENINILLQKLIVDFNPVVEGGNAAPFLLPGME